MDAHRFDEMTKTRRGFVGTLAGLAAVGIGAKLVSAAPGNGRGGHVPVDLCHFDEDTGTWEQITVDERAVPAHVENHGDYFVSEVDFATDVFNCGGCGIECPESEDPGFFAVCEDGVCGFEEFVFEEPAP
jgi:hypothetical protein